MTLQYVFEQLATRPLVSSTVLPWPGIWVERYHLETGELPAYHHAQHLLTRYQTVKPVVMRRQYCRQWQATMCQAGEPPSAAEVPD